MQTLTIVPGLNVLEDGRAGQGPRGELTRSTIELEGRKKAFHGSIVIAVGDTAHADLAFETGETLLVDDAGISDASCSSTCVR